VAIPDQQWGYIVDATSPYERAIIMIDDTDNILEFPVFMNMVQLTPGMRSPRKSTNGPDIAKTSQ
jgi:hypothetical protein